MEVLSPSVAASGDVASMEVIMVTGSHKDGALILQTGALKRRGTGMRADPVSPALTHHGVSGQAKVWHSLCVF